MFSFRWLGCPFRVLSALRAALLGFRMLMKAFNALQNVVSRSCYLTSIKIRVPNERGNQIELPKRCFASFPSRQVRQFEPFDFLDR